MVMFIIFIISVCMSNGKCKENVCRTPTFSMEHPQFNTQCNYMPEKSIIKEMLRMLAIRVNVFYKHTNTNTFVNVDKSNEMNIYFKCKGVY